MIKNIFIALLGISMVSLWLLNILSGIVGGIWLIASGGLSIVLLSLIYSIIMPWVYTIATLPTWLLIPVLAKASEKGMRFSVSVLGFIISGYDNFILSLWTIFIFTWLVNNYTHYSLIAILLWGYSIVMGPVGYMASKEGPDAGPGTTIGVLFTQIAYLTLTINTLFLFAGYNLVIPLWIIILVFTSFTAWMGFISVPKKVAQQIDSTDSSIDINNDQKEDE